jgi:hypothetical protein
MSAGAGPRHAGQHGYQVDSRDHYQIVNPVTRENALKPVHCRVDFTHQRLACMAPRLVPRAHKALTLLADARDGAASELFMIANGVKDELLDKLVRASLVTVVTEIVRVDTATVKVKRFRITDHGRKALAAGRQLRG